MSPQAKIAVLTFALRIIKNGTNYPRDLARAALSFVDGEERVEITRTPPAELIGAAFAAAKDEAALVAAAERRAAARKKRPAL